MTDILEVNFEEAGWSIIDFEGIANKAALQTYHHFNIALDWQISILACNDARIKTLNGDFRKKDKATNVLSWPSLDLPLPQNINSLNLPPLEADGENSLGDIAISYETVVKEAKESNITLENHLTHLIIHSVLHLLGFDHISDKDATIMQALESNLLAKLDISDPYEYLD